MTDETNTTDTTAKPAAPIVTSAPAAQPAVITATVQPDLKTVADVLLSEIPEQLRGLIPKVEPAAQIEWFAQAKKTGVFSTGAPSVPETDAGRKPSVSPVEPNLNDLPPMARMSRGYGQ